MKRKQRSVLFKIAAPSVSIIAVLIAAVCFIANKSTFNSLFQVYQTQLESTSRDINRQMAEFYEIQIDATGFLASNPLFLQAVQKGEIEELNEYLSSAGKKFRAFESLLLSDPLSGRIVAGSEDSSLAGSLLKDSDLGGVLTDRTLGGYQFSSPFKSLQTGNPVVLVRAVLPADLELLITFDLGRFSAQSLVHAVIGITGYPFVCDEEGLVVAHPTQKHVMNLNLTKFEFGQIMMDSPDGTLVEYLWEGEDKILSIARDDVLGLVTGTTMYVDDINQAAGRVTRNLAAAGTGAILLLAGILILLFMFVVTNPLGKAVEISEHVARGDLTDRFEITQNDEIGRLQQSQKDMIAALNSILTEVASSSETVASGSQQMSISAVQVSQGANTQAAGVEEVAASIEQITTNIEQTADNAGVTEQIAKKVAAGAGVSCTAVNEALEAVSRINNEIGIIGEISRQTNMLALNAAIEAARAGEAGKGFAVVASEVRKLAEKSSRSANSIMDLSQQTVSTAQRASQMLNELMPDINRTSELVQEISFASKEQHSGVQQINKAVQQQDHVIQQNASVSEELTATAENLAGQASGLLDAVRYFKVEELK